MFKDKFAIVCDRPIRVLLVDDTPDVRNLVRILLGTDPAFAVVGEATNGREGLEAARALDPDLVLLDWQMPVLDGLATLPLLRDEHPQIGIVMFSSRIEPDAAPSALAAGADRYVVKGTEMPELRRHMREVGERSIERRGGGRDATG